MSVQRENYCVVDFKKGTLVYRPNVEQVTIHLWEEREPPLEITFFYDNLALERFLWFSRFLSVLKDGPSPAIFLRILEDKTYGCNFFMDVPNFPVARFAKNFKLERLVRKKIEVIDARVSSSFRIRGMEEQFCSAFRKYDICSVKVENQFRMELERQDEPFLSLQAEVMFPPLQ